MITRAQVVEFLRFLIPLSRWATTSEAPEMLDSRVYDRHDTIVKGARELLADVDQSDIVDPLSLSLRLGGDDPADRATAGTVRSEFESRVRSHNPGVQFPKPPPPPPRPPTPPPEPIHPSRASRRFIDVVCDGPPGPEAGRFVEVEDANGRSINAGEWINRGDGYWALRIEREEPRRINVWEFGLAVVLGIVLGFVMLHPGCGAR